MMGTYIVAGIFAVPCDTVTVTQIREAIPVLYSATKKAKRGWWPRGISGMFLLPCYVGTDFGREQIEWVQRRHPFRWAIWHEPMLYDIHRNAVWMRKDYGLYGRAFRPLVVDVHRRALKAIAELIHQPFPDFINGIPTSNERQTEPSPGTYSSKAANGLTGNAQE